MSETDSTRDRLQILVLSVLAANLLNVWLVCDGLAHLWPGVGIFEGPNFCFAIMVSLVAVPVSLATCVPPLKRGEHKILAGLTLVLAILPVPLFCVTLHCFMSHLGLVYK